VRLVEERRIADRVLFLGERRDVAELYNVCDIKVLASLYEGTANVLLEAMSCGLPVIATKAGDNARVVVDGDTGLVVGVDDLAGMTERLKRLLTDTALRERMGCAARARVERQFSIPAMAHRTGDLYLRVLRSKGVMKEVVT
jgi:glycosyltransferase involved in cell wall biosynthesis